MVAESMVMRRPMTQVGCLRACSGVMPAKSASGVWRKGPPDAVSQMNLTSWRADAHALVHGVVLAVDGQNWDVALAGGGGEDFARGYHAFLVGQADGLAGENRGVGGFESGHSDNGRDHEVRLRMRGAGNCAFAAMDDVDARDSGWLRRAQRAGGQFFGGQRNDLRTPADGLREGFVDVAAGSESVATW